MKNDNISNQESSRILKFVCIGGGFFVIIGAFLVGAVFASAHALQKFPKQFFIAGIDISGKTPAAARADFEKYVAQIKKRGIIITSQKFGEHKLALGINSGVFYDFDTDTTISNALQAAGTDALSHRIKDFFGMNGPTFIEPVVVRNEKDKGSISGIIDDWKLPLAKSQDAQFKIIHDTSGPHFTVVPDSKGEQVDVDSLEHDVQRALILGDGSVELRIMQHVPIMTTETANSLVSDAQKTAQHIEQGRILKVGDSYVSLNSDTLVSLLQPRYPEGSGKAVVQIDATYLRHAIGENKISIIEHPAKNGVFEYKDKRVTKFVPSQKGIAVDWDTTAVQLFNSLNDTTLTTSTLIVATKETEPEIPLEKTNTLGIKEILGVGSSDFRNSPKNRIHNITIGMNSVNGSLIAPDETFSLIKTLGKIDGSTGYLEELVIKENKTKPEFGGGLCQIGTTTFRAAMESGFPIVERRNHSYQVSYYFENGVSGTDATIYDPKPDLRFTNDTGHWVFFQTEMRGTKLFFTVWGTRDGRKASRTIPKVLATQPAPPSQVIETTDIPVGKVKCTEHAHAGATTIFTYTVQYPDGNSKKTDFQSYYKPWGEVCLHGVAATSTPSGVPISSVPLPTADGSGTAGN